MPSEREGPRGRRGPEFRTTQWSLVIAAGDVRDETGRAALGSLCETYWFPVYAFVRRRGNDPEAARDLTQAFFATLLEKNYAGQADRGRGRFRTFLLASVKHFLANEWDREQAAKRGGGVSPLPLEWETAEHRFAHEPAQAATPETLFEKRWAEEVIDRTLARIEREIADPAKRERFERLRPLVLGRGEMPSYARVAEDLGVGVSAVKVAVHRLRRRFGDALREEIAETVDGPGEVDREIRHLLTVLES